MATGDQYHSHAPSNPEVVRVEVRLGNPDPKVGYRLPPVSEDDHTFEELLAIAAERGAKIDPRWDDPGLVAWAASDALQFKPTDDEAPRVTYIHLPDHEDFATQLLTVVRGWPPVDGLPPNQSGLWAVSGFGTPSWVSCPGDPALEAALARHFGCPVGEPEDLEATHWTSAGPPGVGVPGAAEVEAAGTEALA